METFGMRFIAASLIVVFSAPGLLSCGGASKSRQALVEARESVLRDDLSQMRKLIDQYTFDNGKPPQSLEDLKRAGYLGEVPDDPVTGKKDWRVVIGESPSGKGEKGVIDIRSASAAKSTDGKPYSEW